MRQKIVNGHTAVLVSKGTGTGFATQQNATEAMIFDPALIDIILDNDIARAKTYVERKYPDIDLAGVDGLSVHWIARGTLFTLNSVDGAEYITYFHETTWHEA